MSAKAYTSESTGHRRRASHRFARTLRRALAGLLLIFVLAGIWWGYDSQTRADPFVERSWWQTFLQPQPHSNYDKIPVKPIGARRSLIPKKLDIDPTKIALSGDAATPGQLVLTRLAAEPGSNLLVAVGADGRVLATRDKSSWAVVALPAQIGQLRYRKPVVLPASSDVLVAAYSPDGSRIISGSSDGTARLWDAATGKLIAVLDGTARKWDAATGAVNAVLIGHEDVVSSAAFSPDGTRVVTASSDRTARVWDAATGKGIVVLIGHEDVVSSAAFSPDGTRVVTASSDRTARVWDAATGNGIAVLDGHEAGVSSAAFSPDGTRVVTASDDSTARVWDAATGAVNAVLIGHEDVVSSAAFSPDGTRVVTASQDNTARIWNAAADEEIAALRGHVSLVTGAAFSSDGTRVVTGSSDGTARIWSATTGAEIAVVKGHDAGVTSAAFSPDGTWVVTSDDKTARVSDAVSGEEIAVLEGHKDRIMSASFSPDGTRVLTASHDGTARIWDVRGYIDPSLGEPLQPIALAAAIAPDGTIWIAGRDGYVARIPIENPNDGVAYTLGREDVPEELFAVDVDGESVRVGGERGGIYASSGDFSSWIREPTGTEETIHAIEFDETGRGWAVGEGGVILHRGAAGKTGEEPAWEVQTQLTEELGIENLRLTDIHPQANGIAWAINEGTFIPRTVFESQNATAKNSWRRLPHFTAPWWFLLGLPALVLAGFANARAWRPDPLPPVESIVGQGTPDRPLSLSDADALNLRKIALSLSRFIRNTNTEPPLTIAVTGQWGAGKSSLMNMLQEDLRAYGGRPVWFNAWHHRQEEHLLAALLENIRAQAIPSWWTLSGVAFRLRLFWLRSRNDFVFLLALAFLLVVAFFVLTRWKDIPHLYAAFTSVWTYLSSHSTGVESWLKDVTVLGVSGAALFALFVWFRNRVVALSANPARLLSKYAGRVRVRDFSDQLSFRYRFGREFADVCTALRSGGSPGLVILIDDLDRCRPQDVLDVLEAVNYFVSVGDCFVVLGMDRRQVEHCVGVGFADIVEGLPDDELNIAAGDTKDDSGRQRAFARHYLEKLINLEVHVPSLTEAQAIAMLPGSKTPNAADEPPKWVSLLSVATRRGYEVLRFGTIGVVLGLFGIGIVHVMEDRKSDPSGPAEPKAPVERVAGAGEPSDLPSSGNDAPARAAPVQTPSPVAGSSGFRVPSIGEVQKKDLGEPWRWVWWGPTLLALIIVAVWVIGIALKRRSQVVQDSPAFQKAMQLVMPLVYAAGRTPRAIKRFQNRMRYLAVRLIPPPPEVDPVEKLVFRIGQKIGRDWVPESRFVNAPAHALTEPKLILLGAVETFYPALQTANSKQFATWLNREHERLPPRGSLSTVPNLHQWQRVKNEFQHDSRCEEHWPTERDIELYRGLVESSLTRSEQTEQDPKLATTAAE